MRWYVVDDHAAFRAAARALLESAGDTVVGESDGASGSQAIIDHMRTAGADAALIDVNLPVDDGFTIVTEVASALPEVRCVLISSRPRSTYQRRLATSVAVGFVSKGELSAAALTAVLGQA